MKLRDKFTEAELDATWVIATTPPVDPPIDPPPPPPPPPPGPVVIHQPVINLARMVMFTAWHQSSRYERFQRLAELVGTVSLGFHVQNLTAGPGGGGTVLKLTEGAYSLKVEGSVVASVVVPANATSGKFPLPSGTVADGWRLLEIVSPNGEPTVPMWMYVNRAGLQVAPSELTPVQSGSYDVEGGLPYCHAMVPARYAPNTKPLPPRDIQPFSTALPKEQLFREDIIISRGGNIRRPVRSKRGIVTTANYQSYHFDRLIHKDPWVHLLDGPRGVGTLSMLTHMMVSHTGGVWWTSPWSFGHCGTDGTVNTLVGYRHKEGGQQWQDAPFNLELVGDWRNVAEDRWGCHELWGAAWDRDSVASDPNAPPQGGLQPHLVGPRLFLADSQMNAIRLVVFSKNDITAPGVVHDFITGLNDPWDVVWHKGKLYVSERKRNQISIFDATTGAYLGPLLAATVQGLATVGADRNPRRVASLDAIRAQDCYLPEGLFILDDWLYFGSKAQGEVRKINLETRELVKGVCFPTIDGNSKFMKIAVGDGTFGPRGTVFSWTWSIANHGMAQAHLPGGKLWEYSSNASSKPISRGRGGFWTSMSYGSSGAVKDGRLYNATAQEGFAQITQALPTDPHCDFPKYIRGRKHFTDKGYGYIYSGGGHGFYGLPLPWGESGDVDYYLEWNGNVATGLV